MYEIPKEEKAQISGLLKYIYLFILKFIVV